MKSSKTNKLCHHPNLVAQQNWQGDTRKALKQQEKMHRDHAQHEMLTFERQRTILA
eukprot:CAMPEP_0170480452 /NCGR_PEP_ID=MMETSP0208-20121228/1291_1 /TAXON_ID=197538 /ORGANISM="Strombidium inclinatum, Strain S3" /LENGTH=55 /DNA_ID=CAMNT_0010753009 /DNA_START=44 /DNA_END=207 /DNA_ORIENTATION=-